MCYSLVDVRKPWPPEGMFGGGSGGPPLGFFFKFEAKPLLLGTFHSVQAVPQNFFPSNHLSTDNQNILEVFSAI